MSMASRSQSVTIRSREQSAGESVSALIYEITTATEIVTANCENSRPEMPGMNITGTKTASSTSVVAMIGVVISRSRQAPPATSPTPGPQPAAPSPRASLLSTSQWITDQLTLELMAAPPAAALQRWATERSRLDNVAIGAQQQYLDAQDPNWQPLSQTMSALAASLDTCLALRAQEPPNPQLISESIDVVNGHRARLHQLVALLLPTIDR